MELKFREKPYDLLVIIIFAILLVVAVALIASGPIRIALGLIFILFLPGYVLIAALFPSGKEIDWIERLAFSFGTSIAVVPLLGLVLNYTPWGITVESVVATVFGFILLLSAAAYYRRMKLPVEERLALTVPLGIPGWEEYGLLDKVLTIGVVISIIVALGILVYAFTVPKTGERFTEFYILDENGMADDYPTLLNVSENGTVIVGVVNHEHANVSYTITKNLVNITWWYDNATEKWVPNETARVTLDTENITLNHDEMWENPFTFSINATGDYKLEFLLYRDGDMSEATHNLHLWIEVQ